MGSVREYSAKKEITGSRSNESTKNSTGSTESEVKIVRNGPNSTKSAKKEEPRVLKEVKKEVKVIRERTKPPSRKGQKSTKVRMKMRTAILNRTVSDLKYDTIVAKCGGSKNTAKQVLEDLAASGHVVYKGKGKGFGYKRSA